MEVSGELNAPSVLTSALDGGEWSASRPSRFTFIKINIIAYCRCQNRRSRQNGAEELIIFGVSFVEYQKFKFH
jgi:hypothetical protein